MMFQTIRVLAIALFVPCIYAEDRIIRGVVLNDDGKPVANASIARFWRANGGTKKADGTPYDLKDPAQVRLFWGNLGMMEPVDPVVTAIDGRFEVVMKTRDRALLIMNSERSLGAIVDIAEVSKDESPISVNLKPLVTVKGQFRSKAASKAVGWSHVYVNLPGQEDLPLTNDRLISCGSFEGKFEFRIPAGHFLLNAYAVSNPEKDDIDLRVPANVRITCDVRKPLLDVGLIELELAPPDRSDFEEEAKKAGRWRNYQEHYGEPAPRWHSVDGKGIDHLKNIDGLKGKHVLLYFWGLSCVPCLSEGVPDLMDFYETNSKMRSDFEIVAVCIDISGEINSIAQLESRLGSIEKNVWKKRKIPFPIVLDNTSSTWERYGISGLGTEVLIDPKGNIVEGGKAKLQSILDRNSK